MNLRKNFERISATRDPQGESTAPASADRVPPAASQIFAMRSGIPSSLST
jgi:hypothetical protein